MIQKKFKSFIFSLIESLIRNVSGGFGEKIRYFWYKRRFRNCGKNVRIKESVIIYNPQNIEVGSNVVIMANTLIDGPEDNPNEENFDKNIINKDYDQDRISIIIEDEIQIGPYNLISGLGGIILKNRVTLSARVSLYSSSHLPNDPQDKSKVTSSNNMTLNQFEPTVRCPIFIGENTWIGLNVSMFGHSIGENCFVKTNSVVTNDLEKNSIYSGSPATYVSKRFDVN